MKTATAVRGYCTILLQTFALHFGWKPFSLHFRFGLHLSVDRQVRFAVNFNPRHHYNTNPRSSLVEEDEGS